MNVQGTVEIEAPSEKVWPYLIEPVKTMQWFTALKKFEYGSDERGLGAPFYWEEQSGNRIYKLHFTTTEWVGNKVFGYKMTSGDFFKSYTERWTLDITENGCRFGYNDTIEFPWGIFGKIIGLFAKKRSTADGKQVMANLKRLAEAK